MIAATRIIEPFPGLRPFTAEESELFFGRDEQIEELLERLGERRFLAVVGTSGSGKSSLIRAGLIPTIRSGHLGPTGSRWVVVTVPRPGLDPIHGLASALAGAFGLDLAQVGEIETALLKSSGGFEEFARARLGPEQRLLLLVDQFEELFRYRKQSGEEGRRRSTAFVKLLLHAVAQSGIVKQAPQGPIYVVLTMRSDYLGDCAQFRGLPEALNDAQFLVPQMSRDQLREAIEGPAAMAGAGISDELVDRLLNDVGNDPDMLPVLQHTLFRVWEVSEAARAQGQPMDVSHYEEESIRGIDQALNLDAEAAFSQLKNDPAAEQIARRAFQRLVEPGAQDEETRRPTRLSEIATVCQAPEEQVRRVLQTFLSRRFISLSDDPDPLVDIAHESFIRLWQRLKQWVIEEAQSASVYRRLSDDAVKKRALYRGSTLAEAVAWRKKEMPNAAWAMRYVGDGAAFDLAIRFLRRSELRQQVQRGVMVAGVLAVLALAALFYSMYRKADEQKLAAEQQRLLATSRQLAAAAQLSRNTQSDRALLLAIEAYRTAPTFEAHDAILASVQSSLGLKTYFYQEGPREVAFGPQGKLLAAGGKDGMVRFWDIAKREPAGDPLQGPEGWVAGIAFSPDGKTLASAGPEATMRLWDVATRRLLGEPLKATVSGVAFSPDGKTLALASAGVRLWDVATGRWLGEPFGVQKYPIHRVAFSPNGKVLALTSGGTLQFWDVATHHPLSGPLVGDSTEIESVAFSPDGKTLASAGFDAVRLWDVATGQPLGEPLKGHKHLVASVAFSPDGKILASGSWDKTVQLWDPERRQTIGEPLQAHTDDVTSVAFSPDGLTLATAGDDNTIRLWDVATLIDLRTRPDSPLGLVPQVVLSPDARILASGGRDEMVHLWDVATHAPLGEPLQGHENYVNALTFSPDGKILATNSLDTTVRLWDVTLRRPSGEPLQAHAGLSSSLLFSPDGKTLVTTDDKTQTMRLWDVATGRPLGEPLSGYKIFAIDFSPDGKTLAFSNGNDVQFWDVTTRRPVGEPLHGRSGAVSAVAFSPDGKTLVTSAESDYFLRLWDVAKRQLLGQPLRGHTSSPSVIAFSPDGKTLASADQYTLRLWDMETQRPLGEPLAQASIIMSMEFSPNSRTLITAHEDRTVRRWDIDAESGIARACSIVNRNLSLAEWRQEIGTNVPYRRSCPELPPGEGAPR